MGDERYSQVCLEPENGTDGVGLAELLGCVASALSADWVSLSDIDLVGSSRGVLSAQEHETKVMPVSRLCSVASEAKQVVWASVFFCCSKEEAETITATEDYVASLRKAKALVRVVDATYYYVYGPVTKMDMLNVDLRGQQKKGLLEELDFPE
jgi:hypothetical protein